MVDRLKRLKQRHRQLQELAQYRPQYFGYHYSLADQELAHAVETLHHSEENHNAQEDHRQKPHRIKARRVQGQAIQE